ncbi:MAG: hypothetical protein M3R24_25975 [Chloroflexota bacterium]|nr:hypothetical protein [Chloroflexota bacterium]
MDTALEQLFLYLGLPAVAAASATFGVRFLWEAIEEAEKTGRLIFKDGKFLMAVVCALVTLVTGWQAISTWFD